MRARSSGSNPASTRNAITRARNNCSSYCRSTPRACHYSEANGWYEFNIASDGTYSLLFGQWLSAGVAKYRPILNDGSEYLQIGNLNYEIGLTCADDILFLHINGKLFRRIDVARYGLTGGKIGITASSFDATPTNVIFDWVKVNPPE